LSLLGILNLSLTTTSETTPSTTIVIPALVWSLLGRMALADEVTLTAYSHSLHVATDTMTCMSRLLEGTYPDYTRVFPSPLQFALTIRRADLLGALKRVALLSAKAPSPSVRWAITSDTLAMSTSVASVGQADEVVEATSSAAEALPEDFSMHVNPHMVLDALGSFTGEELRMEFYGMQSPIILRDTAEPTYQHLFLPLRKTA